MAPNVRWLTVRVIDAFDELVQLHSLQELLAIQYTHSVFVDKGQAFQLLHTIYMEKSQTLFDELTSCLEALDFATSQLTELPAGAAHSQLVSVQNQSQLPNS